jgi:hypothetical protein
MKNIDVSSISILEKKLFSRITGFVHLNNVHIYDMNLRSES